MYASLFTISKPWARCACEFRPFTFVCACVCVLHVSRWPDVLTRETRGASHTTKPTSASAMAPKLGKSYAFCKPGNVDFYVPFCDTTIIRGVFGEDQKRTFEAYRNVVDPDRLFYGGSAVGLVGLESDSATAEGTAYNWKNIDGFRCDMFGYGGDVCGGDPCVPSTEDEGVLVCNSTARLLPKSTGN